MRNKPPPFNFYQAVGTYEEEYEDDSSDDSSSSKEADDSALVKIN